MPLLHSPTVEVLIVDDDLEARELLSEFCQGQRDDVATPDANGHFRIDAIHERLAHIDAWFGVRVPSPR